jgi:erythronate-4-phosphate dehydrogenase
MSLDALCRHFKIKGNYQIHPPMPVDTPNAADYLQLYNPMVDSLALKQHPEQFELLRGNYPIRREPHAYGLQWID